MAEDLTVKEVLKKDMLLGQPYIQLYKYVDWGCDFLFFSGTSYCFQWHFFLFFSDTSLINSIHKFNSVTTMSQTSINWFPFWPTTSPGTFDNTPRVFALLCPRWKWTASLHWSLPGKEHWRVRRFSSGRFRGLSRRPGVKWTEASQLGSQLGSGRWLFLWTWSRCCFSWVSKYVHWADLQVGAYVVWQGWDYNNLLNAVFLELLHHFFRQIPFSGKPAMRPELQNQRVSFVIQLSGKSQRPSLDAWGQIPNGGLEILGLEIGHSLEPILHDELVAG